MTNNNIRYTGNAPRNESQIYSKQIKNTLTNNHNSNPALLSKNNMKNIFASNDLNSNLKSLIKTINSNAKNTNSPGQILRAVLNTTAKNFVYPVINLLNDGFNKLKLLVISDKNAPANPENIKKDIKIKTKAPASDESRKDDFSADLKSKPHDQINNEKLSTPVIQNNLENHHKPEEEAYWRINEFNGENEHKDQQQNQKQSESSNQNAENSQEENKIDLISAERLISGYLSAEKFLKENAKRKFQKNKYKKKKQHSRREKN